MKLRKIAAALAAAAQLVTGISALPVHAEDTPLSLSYISDQMTDADGVQYPADDKTAINLSNYGFKTDGNIIWSVQRKPADKMLYIYEEGFRFSTKSPGKSTSGDLTTLTFENDTMHNNPSLTGGGYIYESEFMVQVKDVGAQIQLNFNGEKEDGTSANMAKVTFTPPSTVTNGEVNIGTVSAVNAYGAQLGNTSNIRITSSNASTNKKGMDWIGQLLYIKAQLDLTNGKYSLWLVPRKTEGGEYAATEATDEYLLVEDAPMNTAGITKFVGITYHIDNFKYGNGVWIKNINVNEYTPEYIAPTPTPTPTVHADGKKLKFAVLSDLQYGRASQDSSLSAYEYAGKKFKNAAKQVIEKAGGLDELDALLIPGDITHNSKAEEWQAFVKDLAEVIPPGSHTKVMFLRGNHDAKDNLQSNFVKYLSTYDSTITSADYVVDVNGYKFVMVSQDTQRANDESSNYAYIHSPETISWFTEAMNTACAESEGKPVFVGMHPNAKDTIYGSFPVTGMRNGKEHTSSYWGTSELYNSLKDHSNAITFSGHSHWDMANERSIHQKDFTSLNTGAVNNMEIEDCWDESFQPKRFGSNENECSGYYVEVDEDEIVTVHRMDFYRKREFKSPWTINVNDKENWKYTDTRDQNPPYFENDAKAEISDITESGCKVTFKQAKDDETDVGHYKLELINNDTGLADKTVTLSSYYWQTTDMPEYNYWNVTGLSPETSYTAKITAYDSFYTESSNVLESAAFTTDEGAPVSAVADVSFNADGALDTSEFARFYGIAAEEFGDVPVSFDESLNMYTASFARTDADAKKSENFFKVYMNNERKALLQDGKYTIDMMFKASAHQKDNNIIGAAQGSGFDMEMDTDGVFSAYLRHNGAWVDPKPGSSLTVEKDKYYHLTITNDGTNIRVYNDGKLVDTTAASGALEFSDVMKNDPYYAMVIGGDYDPTKDNNGDYTNQTLAQNAFSGSIAFVKLYGDALTQSQINKNCAVLNSRKSLTKAGELNTLLTQTLPAIEGTEKVIEQGKKLMAKADLTDAEIDEFIKRAKDSSYYNLPYRLEARDFGNTITPSDYGMTVNDGKNVVWSLVKLNNDNSLNTDSLRITTRGSAVGDDKARMFKLDFANDTKNNPTGMVLKNGVYTYESEFVLLYKGDGYVQLNLSGKDASGNEKDIAGLRFAKNTGNSSIKYPGSAYMVDAGGNRVGNAETVVLGNNNTKDAENVFYVKVQVDLNNNTYSAWLTPRKTHDGSYTGDNVYSKTMLVENQPFMNDGITSFTSISYDITQNGADTNGVFLNNIYVDKQYAENTEFSAAVNELGIAVSGALLEVSAVVENAADEDVFDMYIAAYDENKNLKEVKKYSQTGSGTLSGAITPLDDTTEISVYLWNGAMQALDKKTVQVTR